MNTSADRPGRINWRNVLTVVSAAILIAAEVFGLAYAGGWAVALLMGVGEIGAYVLQGIFFVGGIALMLQFIRHASSVEPFTTR
jgi:hypothetical protein